MQIRASRPLLKNLWAQTVAAKIANQASVLLSLGKTAGNMLSWAKKVNSGDTKNYEARASVYYWKNLFSESFGFTRDRFGDPPNNLLNYGYAVLRALVARSLVGSGLLPTLGIHHKNKYNAYCLADDIMEPYRPFVDAIIVNITVKQSPVFEITKEIKQELLKIPYLDVMYGRKKSPLSVGLQKTTASLANCFSGESKRIKYPTF